MCQKKPGARCAGNLRNSITAVTAQVDQNRAAYHAGEERPHPGAEAHLMELQDEFDETPSGQRELDDQMVKSIGNPALVAGLQHRKAAAARRYAVKQAALAATEAGDERAANIIIKTQNPDTGWLTHSRLNPLNSGAYTRMRIDEHGGHMVGLVAADSTTEYDYDGTSSDVYEGQLVYETPIEPGPTAGTYLTHATPGARRVTDPYLYSEADIDHPSGTFHAYAVEGIDGEPHTHGAPVTVGDLTDSGHVESLTGCENADSYDVRWEETPDVVRNAHGTPVLLRFYGAVTAITSTGARSSMLA